MCDATCVGCKFNFLEGAFNIISIYQHFSKILILIAIRSFLKISILIGNFQKVLLLIYKKIFNKLAKLGDAIAISNLKLSITDLLTDTEY